MFTGFFVLYSYVNDVVHRSLYIFISTRVQILEAITHLPLGSFQKVKAAQMLLEKVTSCPGPLPAKGSKGDRAGTEPELPGRGVGCIQSPHLPPSLGGETVPVARQGVHQENADLTQATPGAAGSKPWNRPPEDK